MSLMEKYMSIDNNDKDTPSLPGLEREHRQEVPPTDANGITSPLDWGEIDPGNSAATENGKHAPQSAQSSADLQPRSRGERKSARTTPRKKSDLAAKEEHPQPKKARIVKANDAVTLESKPARKRSPKAVAPALPDTGPQAETPSMPEPTDEALGFLSDPERKVADLFMLAPESQRFVQYHITNMARLEAQTALSTAYLLATAPKMSPQKEKAIDALIGKLSRDKPLIQAVTPGKSVFRQVVEKEPAADAPPVPSTPVAALNRTVSYSATVQPIRQQQMVTVQFGQMKIAPIHALQTATKPQITSRDDMAHANAVIGTASILSNTPIADLTKEHARELAAFDIASVRATATGHARILAIDAVSESARTQPRYRAEFEQQAPDLAPEVAAAEKRRAADWDKANSISSTLAYVTEAETPLTRMEASEIAESHIDAIRGIRADDIRDTALSHSFQIGAWQLMYKEEFSRQAPDLMEPARAAYKASVEKDNQTAEKRLEIENSIVGGVRVKLDMSLSEVGMANAMPRPALTTEQTLPDSSRAEIPVPETGTKHGSRIALGKRLLRAIGGAAQTAGTWLSDQGKDSTSTTSRAKAAVEKVDPAELANDISTLVPETVAKRFLKSDHDYYFHDKTPAFSDRGTKLATRAHHPEVVRSLVEIAVARQWEEITVKGTEVFRRNTWLEASRAGLKVVGYQPTSIDLAELANTHAKNLVEKNAMQNRASVAVHGDEHGTPATPLKPRDTPLDEKTMISAQSAPQREARSKVGTESPSKVEIKKTDMELLAKAKSFENDKPGFVVKKHPDLAPAYGIVEAAKAFAAEKLPVEARDAFIGIARRHVIDQIIAGQEIHGPKIYVAHTKSIDEPNYHKSAEKNDKGKQPQSKELGRER